MLLSLTADEVMWLLEKSKNDDCGDEDDYEVDPYHMAKALARQFVEIIPRVLAAEEMGGEEFAVELTFGELWVLREKVSVFDKTPAGDQLGMKLLLKIYSAILKAEEDNDFFDSIGDMLSKSRESKTGDDGEYAYAN